jgi:hypothetical protein
MRAIPDFDDHLVVSLKSILICVYQEICFVYVYVGQKGSMSSIYIILFVSDKKVCRYIYFIMFTEQIKKKGK